MRGIERIDEDDAADLVPRQRPEPGPRIPISFTITASTSTAPASSRSRTGNGTHTRSVLAGPEDSSSTPGRASTWRRSTNCAASRTAAFVCQSRRSGHRANLSRRLGAAGGVRRQRARWQQPTSGGSSAGRAILIRRKKYPVIEQIYAGPQGLVRSQDRSAPRAGLPRSRISASSSCRSTAWAPPTAPRRFTMSAGKI